MLKSLISALMLGCSFCGTSAAVRVFGKTDRRIAPFVSACGIIVVLMLAGMCHVLLPAYYALLIAGICGALYLYGIRREKPAWGVMLAVVLFAAYQLWRTKNYACTGNDSYSHWGLVAKWLIGHDTFPNQDTEIVFYQSYPVGEGVWIYYISRLFGCREQLFSFAAHMLRGLAFLTLTAHCKERKLCPYLYALALFAVVYGTQDNVIQLQVDGLLGYMGAALFSILILYRKDWKKAALTATLPIAAMYYVKTGGMFFGALAVVSLWTLMFRQVADRRKRFAFVIATSAFAAAVMLSWKLHLSAAFVSAETTKHAVSLSSYKSELSEKGLGGVFRVAKQIAKQLLLPGKESLIAYAVWLVGSAATFLCASRKKRKCVLLRALSTLGIYALWQIALFAMYCLSMPASEAYQLLSYSRYNSMLLIFMLCVSGVSVMAFLPLDQTSRKVILYGISAAMIAVTLLSGGIQNFGAVNNALPAFRAAARSILEDNPELKREKILVYLETDEFGDTNYRTKYYQLKYEFETADIGLLEKLEGEEAYDWTEVVIPEDPTFRQYYLGAKAEVGTTDDPAAFLVDNQSKYDALVVLHEDGLIDEILDQITIPVYRVTG